MARCDSYYGGECTWYACSTLAWVPEGLGDAGDWFWRAQELGLRTSSTPVPGSVVVYGRGGGYSSYGHVAVVRQILSQDRFLVSEMNYVAWDTVDERASSTWDVVGFILPPAGWQLPGGGQQDQGGGGQVNALLASWPGLAQALSSYLPALTGQLASYTAVAADAADEVTI